MKLPLILVLWMVPIMCYAHDHEKDSLLVKKEKSSLDSQLVSNFYQFPEIDKNYPVTKSITISSAPEFTTESIYREYGHLNSGANDKKLKAKASFEKIDAEDKWISSFSNTHLDALPVGVKHTISEIEYQLGFVKAKFYKKYTELTVFVKVVLPQSDDKGDPIELFFGADNVKLSHEGGIIGDANLVLLGDVFIPFNGGNWMLFLKGGLDFKTGNVQDKTFATINCDGVKEMGIEGGIEFSRNLLLPVGENGESLPETRPWPNGNKTSKVPNRVRGDFKAVASNWNDLVVGVGITPFVLANHKDGFMFSVSKAILDFSDLRTPNISFPGYYHENGLLLPNRESWRGVYIESIQVGMPEAFKTTNSVSENKRVTFEAANFIIDSYGVSGEFSVKNIIPLETGITASQNAWAYSVDELGVVYAANNFMGAKFAGSIRLPISGTKDKGLQYKGIITDEEYMMAVSPLETVSFDILQAKVQLLPNSGVLMRVKNSDDKGNDTGTEETTTNNKKEFFMQARLNGRMAISANQKQSILDEGNKVDDAIVKFKGITFENLVLQTESPLISVKYFGYEDQVKVAGFPVSIDRIGIVAQDREIGIKFDIGVSLMKDAFAAKGGVGIFAKQKQASSGLENNKEDYRYKQRWQYDRLELSRMIVKANMGAIAFEGALDLMDNDPIYGDGFQAKVKATFFKKEGSEGSDKGISCAAIFGKTRTKQNIEVDNGETRTETVTTEGYRYWYIDAAVTGLKIPVFPGLNITGFAGGAFYKMSRKPDGSISEFSPSGLTYVPDNKTELGVKAMVFGAMPDEKAMSVSAGFEIDFNKNYGVNRLGFFGEVQAMKAFDFPNPMGKITGQLQGLANSESLGSKAVKTFSEKAESEYPSEITGQAGVNAKVGMQYDFTNNTFHADMDLYVNVAGGLVQGRASKGRAGWGVIHISPEEWYVHMGTPTDRLGLKMGVGPVSVESGGYFMMGDGLPGSPPPPSEVAALLGLDVDKLDYMRDENSLKSGKGLAFGSDFKIDTGDISFLLLYARFRAGLGFDIMLKDYQQAMCVNTGDQVGINGWYANGQAYAYLQGELGIKVKLFAVSKKVPIIQGGAAILMQAKGPNPFWMRGYAAGYYDLLGGAVKGAYRFKVEVGEMCQFQDDTPIGDIKMISDLTPADNDQNIDVFIAPQATFVMKVGEPITISENGGDKTYKILLDKFMVTDESGKEMSGKLEWAHTMDRVTFIPDDILPPETRLKAIVEISFQEKISGVYRDVMLNGKKAAETLERNFTTGTAPDYIPLQNIEYAYPVVDQQQFYKGESDQGYIQLERGQDYLFDNTQWESKVKFIDQSGKILPAKFGYNIADNRVVYTLPKVDKETTYTMSIISTTKNRGETNNETEAVTETTSFGEDNTMEVKKNKGAIVLKKGEVERIAYEFKTSKYKKFADKIKAMSVTHNNVGAVGSSSDMIYLYSYIAPNEGFDLVELLGNSYTANKPLVSYEATLVDTYYQKDIEPLIYANYPISGIYLFRNRDPGILGISPKRALPIKSSYLTSLEKNQNKTLIQTHFPFEYDLPRIYKRDFIDLRNQVLKDFTNNVISGTHPAMRLLDGDYLFMRYGKYEVVLKYVLPGGIEASQAKFDFKNPLEYRM